MGYIAVLAVVLFEKKILLFSKFRGRRHFRFYNAVR